MLFDETIKWKCLATFMDNPEKEFFVNGIARDLKISAGSASRVCHELEGEGYLKSEEKGTALFYSLDNESPVVKRLKSAWFLKKLMKYRSSWENDEVLSAALYGSRSSGEFISKSDVDIIIITNAKKESIEKGFEKMKKDLGAMLTVTIFTLAEWMDLAKKKDRFYIEVIANHTSLSGAPLVVG